MKRLPVVLLLIAIEAVALTVGLLVYLRGALDSLYFGLLSWNLAPLLLWFAAVAVLNRFFAAPPASLLKATIVLLVASVYLYSQLLMLPFRTVEDIVEREPNLVWMFAPGYNVVLVLAAMVVCAIDAWRTKRTTPS